MQKFFGFLIICLFLNNCGAGYSVVNAYIENEYSNGLEIRSHSLFSKTSYSDITSMANSYCTSRGFFTSRMTYSGKAGEFKTYDFKCENANQRTLENEYDRYIAQCEYIGFKKNTEKMGECVLKLHNTETKLSQLSSQQRSSSSSDVLTNMLLLNESLKLLNPPRPKSVTCQARPFGTFMNVYCN